MAKRPYMAIYPGDLLKDPCVVPLSLEAKGFWMLMLFAMHELDTGTLTGTVEDFARRAGGERPAKIKRIITELERYGTADIKRSGRDISVTCRRLSRECRGREYERNRKQAQRLKKVSRECPGESPEVSPDMSVSASISCTDLAVVVGSSSAREEQQQTTNTVVKFPERKTDGMVPLKAILSQGEFEVWLDEMQAAHPDIDVRKVRDKLRRAGGDQTKQRLKRWIETEFSLEELPPPPPVVTSKPGQRDCRFCEGTGWQSIDDGARGRVVECQCNGRSAYQEPVWTKGDNGWRRAMLRAAEC